jgi:hypothetical protein
VAQNEHKGTGLFFPGRPAKWSKLSLLAGFVYRAQAAIAQVEPDTFAIEHKGAFVRVGLPAPIGPPFGVTYIMAMLR